MLANILTTYKYFWISLCSGTHFIHMLSLTTEIAGYNIIFTKIIIPYSASNQPCLQEHCLNVIMCVVTTAFRCSLRRGSPLALFILKPREAKKHQNAIKMKVRISLLLILTAPFFSLQKKTPDLSHLFCFCSLAVLPLSAHNVQHPLFAFCSFLIGSIAFALRELHFQGAKQLYLSKSVSLSVRHW